MNVLRFTNHEKYQDSAPDFTEILNQYTNPLLEEAVSNFNEKRLETDASIFDVYIC